MIKPNVLHPGDQVALISPASPPTSPREQLASGKKQLEQLGLRVVTGRYSSSQTGYFAGSDRQRTGDLLTAVTNPAIKAIFCSRGGYGCAHLLEQLNIKIFRQNPKLLIGFSDITLLHLALQTLGLTSYWGPMPSTTLGLSSFSAAWLAKGLFSSKPIGMLPPGRQTIRSGTAKGRLTGGTLALLCSSIGTPYEIKTKGSLVFIEDVGEEPYRIDRMLTHLLAAGKLRDAAGILLGQFRGCRPTLYPKRKSFTLTEVLLERLHPLKIPVCHGFPFGHIENQVTLPYGVMARMDAKKCTLEIVEAGVR